MYTPPTTLAPFLWHHLKLQWVQFSILLLCMLGWSIQESVYPYIIKLLVDALHQFSGDKAEIFVTLKGILLFGLILWVCIEILFRVYDFLCASVYPRFQAKLRIKMLEYSSHHSHQYFTDNFAGSIASKMSRMADASLNIIIISMTIFFPIITAFCISSFILYQAKPIFGLIMFSFLCLHLTVTFVFTKRCAHYSSLHSADMTTLNGKIVDILSNVVNVRLFSRQSYEIGYFQLFQTAEMKSANKLFVYNAKMKIVLGLISLTFTFSMIGFGIYGYREDWITLGELTLILSSLSLAGLAWYMGMHLIKIYEDIGTCKEALTIMQKSHDIQDVPNAKPLKIEKGEIIFDQVSFYYTRNQNIFENKTVTIHPGQKVGLIGYSGSGKTTFVNLMLRYFDIDKGAILIDRQNIKNVTQSSLREQVALIPQDTTLFHRSLMENIRYGNLHATDLDVIEASKRAHCHEFIEHLEHGYETIVGERGVKLSGGQRQRIAIARAILKDARLLILDEATSALDSVTEKYIQESLKFLMQNKTTIVIAHRLSTLSEMDRILVFKNGQIIEDGSPKELLANAGHYAELWHTQADGFLPNKPKRE